MHSIHSVDLQNESLDTTSKAHRQRTESIKRLERIKLTTASSKGFLVRYEESGNIREIYRLLLLSCRHLGRGWLAPGEAEEKVVLYESLVRFLKDRWFARAIELTIGKMVAKTLISSDVGVMWWCQS